MNKLLRNLALTALVALPAAASAQGVAQQEPKVISEALTQVWLAPQSMAFSGSNWTTTPNPRFATAKDGKMYTINMETKSIAEVTATGITDVYTLTKATDLYHGYFGSAIGVDEAGNFLIGREFVAQNADKKNYSSQVWAVYSPATDKLEEFEIPEMPAYRIDCVGRILGDLTKEAYFYLAPAAAGDVSIIKVTGDGTVESIEAEIVKTVAVAEGSSQAYVQPAYETLAEAGSNVYDFYYVPNKNYHVAYINGQLKEFAKYWSYNALSARRGFATFTVGGKRYFVGGYNPLGDSQMGFTVMDENGAEYLQWYDENYVSDAGFTSIIADPNADGTVNIFIYSNGNNKGGAAGMFVFDPAKAGEAKSNVPVGVDASNPYKIATAQDLTGLAAAVISDPFYAEFTADIDMAGVAYTSIDKTNTIHLEGNGHVIKNLAINSAYAALFKNFTGSIKNLGVENMYMTVNVTWGMGASLMGYAVGTVTIDNCYATGYAEGSYSGGLAGGVQTNASLTVTNSYADVTLVCNHGTKVKDGYAGGIVAACNNGAVLSIENCYASGSFTGTTVGGIAAGKNNAYTPKSMTLNNVIVWDVAITAGTANAWMPYWDGSGKGYISEGTTVNGSSVASLASPELTLQGVALSWGTFNKKLNDGMPVLTWQEANGEGLASATAYISATEGERGEAATDSYDLDKGTAYVTIDAPEYFTVKYAFADAASFSDYSSVLAIKDNGTLTYYVTDGENTSEETEIEFTGADTSAISDITVDEAADAVYYNLQGVRVANPENGVFVRVAGGKASKIAK